MSTFRSPLKSGTVKEGAGVNLGDVVLAQSDTFDHTQVGVNTATGIVIPANSRIHDIMIDGNVIWNSLTSDSLEIGTVADADAYGDVADIQALGRLTVTQDAAQIAARADVGSSDITISTTVTETGTSASTGSARITVLYSVPVAVNGGA